MGLLNFVTIKSQTPNRFTIIEGAFYSITVCVIVIFNPVFCCLDRISVLIFEVLNLQDLSNDSIITSDCYGSSLSDLPVPALQIVFNTLPIVSYFDLDNTSIVICTKEVFDLRNTVYIESHTEIGPNSRTYSSCLG